MWYQKPMRIAAMQCDSGEDADNVRRRWCEMGFNVEQLLHVSAKGWHGYFRHDKADAIRRYIDDAKKEGLRIIFYFWPIGTVKDVQGEDSWRMTTADGTTTDSYCVNSPCRDWLFEQIRHAAGNDIDGVFLDGPYFTSNMCYCGFCRSGYTERFGGEIPAVADPKDPRWRDFLEFKYDSIARFLADAGEALKSVKPEAIIYMNAQGFSPGYSSARNNRRLIPHQDILGAEGGFIFYGPPDDVPWYKPGLAARLIESQAGGKPTVIFIAGDHKLWSRYIHTPAETRLLIAATVANGASPWYGIHSPADYLDSPGGEAAGEMMRFLRDNERYYDGTESVAETAVLWSLRTADYYSMESEKTDFTAASETAGKTSYVSCVQGFCEMLLRLHVPFDIIDEQTLLEEKLSKYKTLILPNCALLNEVETESVRGFVRSGGNLIATHETSVYDENVSRKSDFGLSDVFGANLGDEDYDFRGLSYMSPTARHRIFKGCPEHVLPAPTRGLEVSKSTAKVLGNFRKPLTGQYQPIPEITTPAVLLNKFGQGRSLYLAGNFGEHFKVHGIVDHMRMLDNALRMFRTPLLQTRNLPETVEVVLRRQEKPNRLLVHLVNFTGTMRRPISNIVEIAGAVVQISKDTLRTLGIDSAPGVRALMLGKELRVRETTKGFSIRVPRLREYEVLVVEGK